MYVFHVKNCILNFWLPHFVKFHLKMFTLNWHVNIKCCQSLSGCTVPQTQTGGCLQRSRSTKCSVTPWATLVRAGRSAHSWAAAAAAPAACTWMGLTDIYRRTICIWKAARTANQTEVKGEVTDKCLKCSCITTYLETPANLSANKTFQKFLIQNTTAVLSLNCFVAFLLLFLYPKFSFVKN